MGTLSVEKQEKLEADAAKAERKAEKKAEQEAKKKEVRRFSCFAVTYSFAGRKDRYQASREDETKTPDTHPRPRSIWYRPKESGQDDG